MMQKPTQLKSNSASAEVSSEVLDADPEAGEWLTLIETSLATGLEHRLSELTSAGDPCWASLYSLLKRIHKHTIGAVALFYNSHWEPLEVVARAIIEASATSILLAKKDRETHLSQFLTHHFSTMKKRVLSLDKSVIDSAKKTFDRRESLVKDVFVDTNIRFDIIGWPKTTKDRFSAAGMAYQYSHIYSNLSSNVHGDAEYLIDDMIQASANAMPDAAELSMCEKRYWARYFVYNSLLYYAFAVRGYAVAYELNAALAQIDGAINAIESKLSSCAQEYRRSVTTIKSRITRGIGFR
jgi:hypothetical protein